nr:hypothetical protein CFP56_28633 [Quercus suber]
MQPMALWIIPSLGRAIHSHPSARAPSRPSPPAAPAAPAPGPPSLLSTARSLFFSSVAVRLLQSPIPHLPHHHHPAISTATGAVRRAARESEVERESNIREASTSLATPAILPWTLPPSPLRRDSGTAHRSLVSKLALPGHRRPPFCSLTPALRRSAVSSISRSIPIGFPPRVIAASPVGPATALYCARSVAARYILVRFFRPDVDGSISRFSLGPGCFNCTIARSCLIFLLKCRMFQCVIIFGPS